MSNRLRLLLGVWSTAIVLSVAGCTSRMSVNHGIMTEAPRPCPGFQLTKDSFNVTSVAGADTIGPGSIVRWNKDAVSSGKRFTVTPLIIGNTRVAGIRISPPENFSSDVVLRLSYAACPLSDPNKKLYIITRSGTSGEWTRITSVHSNQAQWVEASTRHFSEYAIAN